MEVAGTDLDRIVIISLARRQAKRASMLQRTRAAAIEQACTVFDAVDGLQLDAAWLREHGYAPYGRWRIEGHASRFFRRELKWGEVGCAISHLRVWEQCAARAEHEGETRPTLVLEDDIVFPDDFARKLASVLHALARAPTEHGVAPPDFVYLLSKPIGTLARGERSREVPIDAERQLVLNPPPSWKMGAYLLFPEGARKLARSAFRSNLVPVDDFLPAIATGHPLRPDLTALFSGGGGAAAEPRWFVAYAVGPSLVAERRMSMSDTECSAEMRPDACTS
ncbi:hypothetical protein KFE25_009020 [Diacronema lutheri]|uniref:Glycosyl transferase family 25 domain-containing protein n=1 Tax=Diacronema lutheri TaxID=2081491 RepID=A0A8J5Y415_DIALT|nr:hypothetical protein KFE25_009020 [Diacronema lutheri]